MAYLPLLVFTSLRSYTQSSYIPPVLILGGSTGVFSPP